MLHENKENFIRTINEVAMQTGFLLPLVEKDYYLTLLLSRLNELSPDLIFEGGTCLNKIHYSYYRLSEDLDFSIRLPDYSSTRGTRRKCIQPIKDNIESYTKQFGMYLDDKEKPGRNESKQYIYYLLYDSLVLPQESKIKLEIGLRFNPIYPIEKNKIQHKFLHPFTGEPLFEGGEVNCLSLKELIAEKLRAAATRERIAPRDFYDIDFVLRRGFHILDPEVVEVFKKKLSEDGTDTDLAKYRVNLGRRNEEIKDMESRINEELLAVLTPEERQNFNLNSALVRINAKLKDL